MALPILTLDERVLSPRLGFVFHRRWVNPYESIVGMLWKFVRLNALPGHSLVTQLSRVPIDPYEGLEPTRIDLRAVARLLGLTQRSVRTAMGPLGATPSPCLRICPSCVGLGYHGTLHQLARFDRCPVHGEPIEAKCRHCSRPSEYRLDAQLLDAPFRCRHCRGHYGRSATGIRPRGLAASDRVAVTRALLS